MHFSNHLDTATGPPPSKQSWDEETLLGQGKVYRGVQTTTLLGGEGERGKIKADRVNCPKNFVLHFWFSNESFLSIGYSGILQSLKIFNVGNHKVLMVLKKISTISNELSRLLTTMRVTFQCREGIVWANCSYISDIISNIFDVWLVRHYFCSLYWCPPYDMTLSTVICWHLAFWNAST